jgi:hypothetical protein
VTTPIGILNTAIGGQRIEEYAVNTTLDACTQRAGEDIPWWDGQLYGQQVAWSRPKLMITGIRYKVVLHRRWCPLWI